MTQYNFWKAVLFVSLGIFPVQSLAGIKSFEVQSAANSGNTHPAGETIEIRCSIDGMTEPQVNIFKTPNSDLGSIGPLVSCQFGCGQSVEHYEFSISTSNGLTVLTILIKGLKRDKDEMYWTCQASQGATNDRKSLKLIIATAPKDVVVPLIPACDLANAKCVVTCKTSSCTYPSPTFHWLYTTVKSVSIEPVPGAVLDVVEQQLTNISCRSSGSRPQSTVSWFKQNGQTSIPFHDGISDETTTNGDSLIVTISTLTFRVTRLDQGWILTCTASNFGATGISANNPKTLNVLYSPSITGFEAGLVGDHLSRESVTVNEYQDITGTCQVNSNPAPSIEVSQRALSLAKANNSKVVNFLMPNVTCQNNGQIICKSWNDVPRSSIAEKALQLNIICSPRIERSLDPFVVAKEKTTATLSLSILSYPLPSSYRWYRRVTGVWKMVKNDTNFLTTSHPLQYNLTVTVIQRQHYGEYNVTISNGEEPPLTFTFYLQNTATPEIPIDISVTPISPTAITVKWTPGYDGGLQQSFHIQYKTSSENEWASLVVEDSIGSERVSVDIQNLQPSTIYMLRMFSSNKEGNSATSEILIFYTCAKGGTEMDSTANIGSVAAGCSIGGFVAGMAVSVLVMLGCKRFRNTKERQDTVMRTEDETQRDNGQHQYEDLAQRNNEQEYEKCQLDRI